MRRSATLKLLSALVLGSSSVFATLQLTSALFAEEDLRHRNSIIDYQETDQTLVNLVQPPPQIDEPIIEDDLTVETRRRRPRRLEDAPDMFGDLITRGLVSGNNSNDDPFGMTFPFSRTSKISEHNGVLPSHRVLLLYNHFHNSQQTLTSSGSPTDWSKGPLDRITIGVERPFLGGLWSAEVRMAFLGQGAQDSGIASIEGGDFGNLAVILKRLVYESDESAISIGMGIDTPTGSDALGGIPFDGYSLRVRNQAVHLLPYIGFLSAPDDRLFFQGFAQIDIALGGNPVELSGAGSFPFLEEGVLTEQNYLYLDLAAGYWLYQNPNAYWLTGLAANVELHYSRTLQNRDSVDLSGVIFESSQSDGLDILNFTFGLQATIGESTNLRIGAVVPFEVNGQRCFDSELQAALVQEF